MRAFGYCQDSIAPSLDSLHPPMSRPRFQSFFSTQLSLESSEGHHRPSKQQLQETYAAEQHRPKASNCSADASRRPPQLFDLDSETPLRHQLSSQAFSSRPDLPPSTKTSCPSSPLNTVPTLINSNLPNPLPKMSTLPRTFWSSPIKYLRWAAHEKPAIFYSVILGLSGPVSLLFMPQLRRWTGDEDPKRIPLTYPGE